MPDTPSLASPTPNSRRSPAFNATRWSLVSRAADPDPATAQRALAELCESYWFPVYAFVRQRVQRPEDAEDLTQDFFAKILRLEGFSHVSADRGKLRSYLLAGVTNHLREAHSRSSAAKRGGGCTLLSLDHEHAETRLAREASSDETPETLFTRRWTLTLLENVLQSLRDEYTTAGKAKTFAILQPAVTGETPENFSTTAGKELSLSASAVRVALHRLRARYRHLLRATVADGLDNPSEEAVTAELEELISAIT